MIGILPGDAIRENSGATELGTGMIVLGIETSCDETAAAIVARDGDGRGRILADVVLSQIEQHAAYGGVVPEIAARAHIDVLDRVVERAMAEAGLDFADLDGIAATAGPGLIGGVIVGLMTGKAIASVANRPFVAVNHLEGHALTARLSDAVPFPYLLLLVSGGHTEIVKVSGVGRYERWGATIDDALGEAFDKTAKLLGLPYPGGPAVERAALSGDPARFALPRPLIDRDDLNFSLSGLKTAVRLEAEKVAPLGDDDVADVCASFQAAISDVLAKKVGAALDRYRAELSPGAPLRLVVAGGVAANEALRTVLDVVARDRGAELVAPPLRLCTDNGAMIAWAGAERLALGIADGLDTAPRARWPLAEVTAPGNG